MICLMRIIRSERTPYLQIFSYHPFPGGSGGAFHSKFFVPAIRLLWKVLNNYFFSVLPDRLTSHLSSHQVFAWRPALVFQLEIFPHDVIRFFSSSLPSFKIRGGYRSPLHPMLGSLGLFLSPPPLALVNACSFQRQRTAFHDRIVGPIFRLLPCPPSF